MIAALITITILLSTYAGVGFVCFWWGVNHQTRSSRQESRSWKRRALSAEKTADMLVSANIDMANQLRAARHGMQPLSADELAEWDRLTRGTRP
jgi:hypothetical protein